MRLKPWEITAAGTGIAFAAIFLFSNASGLGFGLLAAVLLWVLTRIEILENHDEPGHYTTARGQLGVLKLVLLLGIYGAAVYGLFVIQHDFGSKARATVIAEFAILGLCLMLAAELWRSGDAMLNWFVGARAEREIGAKLMPFKQRGWLVLHGYKRSFLNEGTRSLTTNAVGIRRQAGRGADGCRAVDRVGRVVGVVRTAASEEGAAFSVSRS